MSKYSAEQVAEFHELRRDFIEAGASPRLAAAAAFFGAAKPHLGLVFDELKLRSDETGEIFPHEFSCGVECCGFEGLTLFIRSGEARKCFQLT